MDVKKKQDRTKWEVVYSSVTCTVFWTSFVFSGKTTCNVLENDCLHLRVERGERENLLLWAI